MKLRVSIMALGVLALLGVSFGLSQSADLNPIRLAYLQNDIHQLACWVALEKGFYAQEGLKVTVAGIFRAGPEMMSAFAAGALDAGYVGIAPVTTAVANKTARIVVLAQANSEGSALVVAKDSPAVALRDLKGKIVAVPGHATVQDFLLHKAMGRAGLTDRDIQKIVLKPPEMIGALKNRDIDGFIAWEPFPAKAVTLGIGRVLTASGEMWKDHPCCVLAVEARFLENRREEARKLVKAHVRATDYINRHPREVVTVALKYTGMDEKTLALAMKNVTYAYALNLEAEKEYVHYLAQWKYIRVDDPASFVGRLVDLKILEDVLHP
jgi:NitT/TauT family transport system substrate-binding protein